jgi:hypothetical protein
MFNANQDFSRFRQPFLPSHNICLHHSHHPRLKSEAISLGKNDMDKCDVDLLTLLFSANIQPFQISQIIGQIKGPQEGTFSPKHQYIANKRTEELKKLLLVG